MKILANSQIFRVAGLSPENKFSILQRSKLICMRLFASELSSSSEEIICQSKYFKAKCSFPDEVILVERARYGRMNLSKCVRENFGYIGCSNDVLDVMDAYCSGRKTCSLRILDENFMNMKPCHEDLKSYLGIEYRCIKGIYGLIQCFLFCKRK